MSTKENKQTTGLWVWIVIGIIVATIAVATLYYIGWFDNRTHVDSVNGDNVEDYYQPATGAETPEAADWENADHETLRESITEPEVETATPPSPEN